VFKHLNIYNYLGILFRLNIKNNILNRVCIQSCSHFARSPGVIIATNSVQSMSPSEFKSACNIRMKSLMKKFEQHKKYLKNTPTIRVCMLIILTCHLYRIHMLGHQFVLECKDYVLLLKNI